MSRDSDDRKQRERMAIEPTIPATDVRAGVPDFSSERPTEDAGPGRGTIGVIVGVVMVVGALFLWLGGGKPAPTAATTRAPASTAPASAPTPSAAAKPSTSAAKPAAKAAAKPTTAPQAAAPPVAAPASDGASATPSASAPSRAHAAAHKRHKKPTARAAKHKEVKLPRLPSPPPADP
jgi:hypothetical protein